MNERELALYEDARHWANLAMWSIELQLKRLGSEKREIEEYVMQPLADFHFLLTALCRLRNSALLVSKVADISDDIAEFDNQLPWLKRLRNVLEHIDEYRTGDGRDESVSIRSLQVFSYAPNYFEWLGERVDFAKSRSAGTYLFRAIQEQLSKERGSDT